ncbi:MAG: hypothetical protein H0V05_00035 [Euzebyaceae bacterium]|jgi:hypothetical protein|nr:hypothetical protein [Euzebyaceae bacterium]
MELEVSVTAGGPVAELGATSVPPQLVTAMASHLGGCSLLGYRVTVTADGDGTDDPAHDLVDFGLLAEFLAAAEELGLPTWDTPGGHSVEIGPADPDQAPPWNRVFVLLSAQGPAGDRVLDAGRVLWLADRLGGEPHLLFGVRLRAERSLRLDDAVLSRAWADGLRERFRAAAQEFGLPAWPVERVRISPAGHFPPAWTEELDFRRRPAAPAT